MPAAVEEDESAEGSKKEKKPKKLDMVKCCIAYDYFALVMASLKLMTLSAAWAHKRNCLQAACA